MRKQLEMLIGMTCNQGFYLEVQKFLKNLARLSPGHSDDGPYFRALLRALCAKLAEYPLDPDSKPDLRISIDAFCAKFAEHGCECKGSAAPPEIPQDEESDTAGSGEKTHDLPSPDETQRITETQRPKRKM